MFDLVTDTYQDFINFLVKRNVLDVGIAFIVSSQITKLSNNFIDNIITPVLNGMFGNKNTTRINKYFLLSIHSFFHYYN